MNVEIGADAALFPEKEYIYGIFVAVHGINREKFATGVKTMVDISALRRGIDALYVSSLLPVAGGQLLGIRLGGKIHPLLSKKLDQVQNG
jgi:hypothetical protein